jgi:alpha-L-fucosidase
MGGLLCGQDYYTLRPKPQQVSWQAMEIGVLIHFGTNTWQDREWGDGTAPASLFNPAQFDAEQWVVASKAAGARYLILVAKHHDGFCLWPSRHTDYSVKNSPWRGGKGDAVREVEQACRKHGLKFGIYLSPWDRHEPSYKDNKAYDDYYTKQMTELITRYGEITEWWMDGAGSEGHVYDFDRYLRTLRTYQPNTLVFADVGFTQHGDIRWVGNEDGTAQEENWNVIDRLGRLQYRPAEADTPLREGHWFWHPNAEARLKPLGKLMDIYEKTVGRGAQLLPDVDVARLKEFGDEVARRYGAERAVATSIDSADQAVRGWRMAARPFETPARIDRAVIREDLWDGQKITSFRLMGQRPDGQVSRLAEGTTIGNKRIVKFPPTDVKQVWLEIDSAGGPVRIRSLQVFAAE